jgi:hypothetical protein
VRLTLAKNVNVSRTRTPPPAAPFCLPYVVLWLSCAATTSFCLSVRGMFIFWRVTALSVPVTLSPSAS